MDQERRPLRLLPRNLGGLISYGAVSSPDPLSTTGLVEVLSLIGPKNGDVVLTAGDYQRFVLVQTATEDIIRKIDTVTIL